MLLAIVMWPTDALAIQTILENNYGPAGRRATFLLNPTYLLVSIRNIIGVLLCGAQTAAIWRSFMIPPMVENGLQALGTNRRAIPVALACLIASWVFQPVSGWILGMGLEKLQIVLDQR